MTGMMNHRSYYDGNGPSVRVTASLASSQS
jgi:hypothetical protein